MIQAESRVDNVNLGRQLWQMWRKNWASLIWFEVIYKTILIAAFAPMVYGLFHLLLKLTGYPYLTRDNIFPFLRHPLTLLSLLLILLFMAVYEILDISVVVYLTDQSRQGKRRHTMEALVFALGNLRRISHWKNLPLALLTLVTVPILSLGLVSSYISSLRIPETIAAFARSRWYLMAVLTLVLLAAEALLVSRIYTFHYFTIEKHSFRRASRRSRRLASREIVADAAWLLIVQILFYLLHALVLRVGVFAVSAIQVRLGTEGAYKTALNIGVWVVVAVLLYICFALDLPVSYIGIGALFYARKEARHEPVVRILSPGRRRTPQQYRQTKVLQVTGGVIGVLVVAFYGWLLTNGTLSMPIEYIRVMEVTAHRGASASTPENTMAAFRLAAEQGADWIELDVQQSRDGVIFVMHDASFKRTAGVRKNAWEMDWPEICLLDVGSRYKRTFAGEGIPTLQEVLDFAKEENIRLNIELKPSGHEVLFEEGVVDLVREADFADRCVITSQKYAVLEHIKAYDPEIRTVYVMSVAYGDIGRLSAADDFSINSRYVTRDLVLRMHNSGHQVYAWTVNSRAAIDRMIEMNVDNIITDNVPLAFARIYESRTSNVVLKFAEQCTEWLRLQ